MESCSYDLLHTTNTSMVGAIGERIAQFYLFNEWGVWFRHLWDELPLRITSSLTEKQKRYLNNWKSCGETWVWDFIGCPNNKVFLVEVKTSRPGKPKRGLKGSWRGRSRRGMSQEDLQQVGQLGFHLLLVNVELCDNWQCVVTSRELLAETG